MIPSNTIIGGRYRVVKSIGGGGMKMVYLAEDLRLAARRCALAEMVDSFTSPDMQQQAVSAFQREADMLAQLNNEHIPRIFDRFSDANHHYLVMEYIDGVTLEDELRPNGGKLAPKRIIDIAIQILDTLEYLHNLQPPVIYRDLKPSNVMLTGAGEAKLIDFGIARHFQPLSNATMIGTQGYAPPEQYRGRVETRSDLYALGATMHQALSGRDPANEPPFSFPPLRKLCPQLDTRLAAVVDQALAYDVVNRLPDAAEFKRRLLEIKTGALNSHETANASAGVTVAAASASAGKPQLKLPLGGTGASGGAAAPSPDQAAAQPDASSVAGGAGSMPPARPAPSSRALSHAPGAAGAPTILTVDNIVVCPGCARTIPATSRFCSYCARDLRHPHGAAQATQAGHAIQAGQGAEAETVVLTGGENQHPAAAPSRSPYVSGPYPSADPQTYRSQRHHRARRHRRGLRRPVLILAVIFVVGFVVVRILSYMSEPQVPANPNTGGGAPGAAPYGYGGSAAEPNATQLAALRTALNQSGYTAVHFRMDGGTIVLWGAVPTESDYAHVQLLVFSVAHIFSLEDHIQVQDEASSY
ncbi:MAG: serine/threonine protein kinase [Candidatus Binataceae bacterium]